MTKVKIFVFNDFQENSFVIYDDTKECVIIDPGCNSKKEEQELLDFINRNSLKPVKLLNTHCHIDHILGNNFVKKTFNIPLIIHESDQFLVDEALDFAGVFGFNVEPPPQPDNYVNENDVITFGNSELKIYHVPGHSPGGIVFYSEKNKFVIVGDVLFNGSIGRTDLPGGNYGDLIDNIKDKLFVLGDDVTVYPGHGTITTIGNEKLYNAFFKE